MFNKNHDFLNGLLAASLPSPSPRNRERVLRGG